MSRQRQRKERERRLVVVSKRREPTDDGLTRLVAVMVLHRLHANETAKPGQPEDLR